MSTDERNLNRLQDKQVGDANAIQSVIRKEKDRTQLIPSQSSASPDSHSIIIHFDADAFYAQCEELQNPELRKKPVGVTQKYLIVTCNYHARSKGVRKLMATRDALSVCPDLVLINGEDLTPYRRVSKFVFNIIHTYGPCERLGLDEFFLDVTAEVKCLLAQGAELCWSGKIAKPSVHIMQDTNGSPADLSAFDMYERQSIDVQNTYAWVKRLQAGSMIAHRIRGRISQEVGLRTSAGIACNKMLAKLVSGIHKPDDQTIVFPTEAAAFVATLPVRALPGVGSVMSQRLKDIGAYTACDLLSYAKHDLKDMFGDVFGDALYFYVRGIDKSQVIEYISPKTISVEDSMKECTSVQALERILTVLAPDLITRLDEDANEYKRRPKLLTLKWRLRGQGWSRKSASTQMPATVISTTLPIRERSTSLVQVAKQLLLKSVPKEFCLSLVNLGATNFVDGICDAEQALLWQQNSSPISALSKTQQRIVRERRKFPLKPSMAYAEEEYDSIWEDLKDFSEKTARPTPAQSVPDSKQKGNAVASKDHAKVLSTLFSQGNSDGTIPGNADDNLKASLNLALDLQQVELIAMRQSRKRKLGPIQNYFKPNIN